MVGFKVNEIKLVQHAIVIKRIVNTKSFSKVHLSKIIKKQFVYDSSFYQIFNSTGYVILYNSNSCLRDTLPVGQSFRHQN